MKLKKLLPFASIAGVAAVVAPLVTSCGTKTYKYVFDEDHLVDEWKPENQIAASTETRLYNDKAVSFYIDSINKNKKIFADDIVYYWTNYYSGQKESIESGTCNIKIGKMDSKTNKMSYSYDISLEIKETPITTETVRYFIEIENLEYVMYNVPSVDDQFRWRLEPLSVYAIQRDIVPTQVILNYMKAHDDWKIAVTLKVPGGLEKDTKIIINSKSSSDLIYSILRGGITTRTLLGLPYSYYLFNVEPNSK